MLYLFRGNNKLSAKIAVCVFLSSVRFGMVIRMLNTNTYTSK